MTSYSKKRTAVLLRLRGRLLCLKHNNIKRGERSSVTSRRRFPARSQEGSNFTEVSNQSSRLHFCSVFNNEKRKICDKDGFVFKTNEGSCKDFLKEVMLLNPNRFSTRTGALTYNRKRTLRDPKCSRKYGQYEKSCKVLGKPFVLHMINGPCRSVMHRGITEGINVKLCADDVCCVCEETVVAFNWIRLVISNLCRNVKDRWKERNDSVRGNVNKHTVGPVDSLTSAALVKMQLYLQTLDSVHS